MTPIKIMFKKIRDAKAEYILFYRKQGKTFEEIAKNIPADNKMGISRMRAHKILQGYFQDQLKDKQD